MNNIDNAFREVSTIGEFSREYFSYLLEVLESIDEHEINKLADVFFNLYVSYYTNDLIYCLPAFTDCHALDATRYRFLFLKNMGNLFVIIIMRKYNL